VGEPAKAGGIKIVTKKKQIRRIAHNLPFFTIFSSLVLKFRFLFFTLPFTDGPDFIRLK